MPESTQNTQPPSGGGVDRLKVLTTFAAILGAVATLARAATTLIDLRPPPASATLFPTPSVAATTTATATALPTITPAPSPTWTVLPTKPTKRPVVLLEDTFADANSGWDSGSDSDADWGYHDGEYRIAVHGPDLVVWGNPIQRHDWQDLTLVVDVARSEGPLDNLMGVIVRMVDRGNFYLFSISSDGMYAVQRLHNDEWEDIKPWEAIDAVRPGGDPNQLRLECRDTTMRFYVNEQLLATVPDDIFYSGNVGLAAGSFAEGGVVVYFDNVLVRSLAEP